MKNFVQEGCTLPLTMAASVKAGQLIQCGKFVGVVACDGNVGDTVETAITGVYALPKTPADAITQGQALKMIPATGVVDVGATVVFGVATQAAAAGSTVVYARLTPSAA